MTDEKLEQIAERLLDKVKAACDFDKAGEAADYAAALKDVIIARRELGEL
jgi:hypothetical protein